MGACANTSSGGSYRDEYLQAWKCGLGSGLCVEVRAATAIHTDYVLASCDPALISNVQSTHYTFPCKHWSEGAGAGVHPWVRSSPGWVDSRLSRASLCSRPGRRMERV